MRRLCLQARCEFEVWSGAGWHKRGGCDDRWRASMGSPKRLKREISADPPRCIVGGKTSHRWEASLSTLRKRAVAWANTCALACALPRPQMAGSK